MKKITRKGFTLIETVTYLALLSVILAITFGAFFLVTSSIEREIFSLLESEEAWFISAKISLLIAAAIKIEYPQSGETGGNLVLELKPAPASPLNVKIGLENGAVFIKRGNAIAESLNTGRVAISDLKFTHIAQTENARAAISFSFKIGERQIATTTVEIARRE